MWLWLVVAGLTGGCGEEADRVMTVPSLEYEISARSDDGSDLEVSLKTRGSNEGKTEFAIDETWGGAGAVADQVRDLRARSASGRTLAVDRPEPHRWVVNHAPDEQIEMTYFLSGASSDERTRHRYLPVVGDGLILLIGHTALVRPETLRPEEEVDLTIRWLKRCKERMDRKESLLFGIVQGGLNYDLRMQSTFTMVDGFYV